MQILNLLDRGPIDYMEVDALQRYIHGEVAQKRMADSLIVWQARHVYTAGRRTQDADIPDTSVPVIRMDRGGSVTYHGPGQLVIYPIVKVRAPRDVVAFVRNTELAIMAAMRQFGLETEQVEGRSGVWVRRAGDIDRKLCAIGIKFAEDATMHGLALNVTTDLEFFMRVVPCGLHDAGVISLNELGIGVGLQDVADVLVPELARAYEQFLERGGEPLTRTDVVPLLEAAAAHHVPLPQQTGTKWQPKGRTL